jgi:Protein of unknown function (DUF3761)
MTADGLLPPPAPQQVQRAESTGSRKTQRRASGKSAHVSRSLASRCTRGITPDCQMNLRLLGASVTVIHRSPSRSQHSNCEKRNPCPAPSLAERRRGRLRRFGLGIFHAHALAEHPMRLRLQALSALVMTALLVAITPTAADAQGIPRNVSALCGDGSYSRARTAQAACARHGGIASWVWRYRQDTVTRISSAPQPRTARRYGGVQRRHIFLRQAAQVRFRTAHRRL